MCTHIYMCISYIPCYCINYMHVCIYMCISYIPCYCINYMHVCIYMCISYIPCYCINYMHVCIYMCISYTPCYCINYMHVCIYMCISYIPCYCINYMHVCIYMCISYISCYYINYMHVCIYMCISYIHCYCINLFLPILKNIYTNIIFFTCFEMLFDPQSSMPSVATTTTSSAIPSRQALRSKPSNVVGRKRSFSENWLAHKPSNNVTSGDILQPALKKKRTVTTPKFKHFHTQSINKYCLEHQEEDSEGDIKTCLYKVPRTRGIQGIQSLKWEGGSLQGLVFIYCPPYYLVIII